MSEQTSPRWKRGSAARRPASPANPNLRVSDAERAEVADRLAKHYGDGRLDQAEFNERLDQATQAKTQADLSGVLADLPETDAPGTQTPAPVARQRTRRPYHRILFLALVILITAAAGQALVHFYVPWLLIGLLVFLWLHYGPSRHRRL